MEPFNCHQPCFIKSSSSTFAIVVPPAVA